MSTLRFECRASAWVTVFRLLVRGIFHDAGLESPRNRQPRLPGVDRGRRQAVKPMSVGLLAHRMNGRESDH